jgi:hypothetical protein
LQTGWFYKRFQSSLWVDKTEKTETSYERANSSGFWKSAHAGAACNYETGCIVKYVQNDI